MRDNHTFSSHLTAMKLESAHVIYIVVKVRLGPSAAAINLG